MRGGNSLHFRTNSHSAHKHQPIGRGGACSSRGSEATSLHSPAGEGGTASAVGEVLLQNLHRTTVRTQIAFPAVGWGLAPASVHEASFPPRNGVLLTFLYLKEKLQKKQTSVPLDRPAAPITDKENSDLTSRKNFRFKWGATEGSWIPPITDFSPPSAADKPIFYLST